MTEIKFTIDEKKLKELIYEYIANIMSVGDYEIDSTEIKIEVKSKQNYKSEWETANFRAIYQKNL